MKADTLFIKKQKQRARSERTDGKEGKRWRKVSKR